MMLRLTEKMTTRIVTAVNRNTDKRLIVKLMSAGMTHDQAVAQVDLLAPPVQQNPMKEGFGTD